MSFRTRYFYANIIGLPVVKPKSKVVSDAKGQNAEWITQKVIYVPSQLWVQSFDFDGFEG